MNTVTEKALPSFPEPNKMGAWGSLQTLTHSKRSKDDDAPSLVKVSKSALTEKGLETCTETLGCETGSDIALSNFPVPSAPKPYPSARSREVARKERESLPPPLPSISGVHMECVREGGRLLMRAVTTVPAYASLEAQRTNGRLTLRFTKEQEEEEEEEKEEGKMARSSSSRCNEENINNGDLLFSKAFLVATS